MNNITVYCMDIIHFRLLDSKAQLFYSLKYAATVISDVLVLWRI